MLNLKELRIKKGLSQKKLSEIIGVSQQAIAAYELGTREPNIETLVLICQKMDISFEELIDFRAIQEKLISKVK